MTDSDERELLTLVAADPVPQSRADVAALRAGGRRLLLRRRLAAGAVAAAVVAVVAVPTALLSGGDPRSEPPVAPPTSVPTSAPSPSTEPTARPTTTPDEPLYDRGTVPIPGGGSMVGTWEDADPVGEVLVAGSVFGYDRLIYGTSSRGYGPGEYISVGVRAEDGRLLRLAAVLTPGDPREADGVYLWNGYREEDGSYLLVGSVPGTADVTIGGDEQGRRAVTRTSTRVLPGFTIFYDTDDFLDAWDPLQAAPLRLFVNGHGLNVRDRTYVS